MEYSGQFSAHHGSFGSMTPVCSVARVHTEYTKLILTFLIHLTLEPNVANEYAPTSLIRKYEAHPLALGTPINAEPIDSTCHKYGFRY